MSTEKDVNEIEAQIKEQGTSLRFAEESPEPDPEELMTNVYANPPDSEKGTE